MEDRRGSGTGDRQDWRERYRAEHGYGTASEPARPEPSPLDQAGFAPAARNVHIDDLARIAGRMHLVGVLLEAHGPILHEVLRDWLKGIHSPNLDPSTKGNPSDPDDGVTVDKVDQQARRVLATLRRVDQDIALLRDTVLGLVPDITTVTNDPADWCSNHLRAGLCEPRGDRGDLCSWCYRFSLNHGRRLPPAALLGLKHRTGRVTADQIAAALDADRRNAKIADDVASKIAKGRGRKDP